MTAPSVAVAAAKFPPASMGDESELLARLRAGDNDAYQQLFRTHAGNLLGIALRFFGDTDDAAEVVQDAFVMAFRGMSRFQGTAKLGTWLHRITMNACLMKLRERRRQRTVPLDDLHLAAPGGDDVLLRAESCERVRCGLEQLPPAYQTVIRLRDLEGLDTEETATRLATTTGVVKTRLHRARGALREVLGSRDTAPGTVSRPRGDG